MEKLEDPNNFRDMNSCSFKFKNDKDQHSDSSTSTSTSQLSPDSVYEFYKRELFPAIVASIPILCHRLTRDIYNKAAAVSHRVVEFIIPSWWASSDKTLPGSSLWNQTMSSSSPTAVIEAIRHYFDADVDGHINKFEMLHVREQLAHLEEIVKGFATNPTGFNWFQQAWPMMDWKVGVFLWRSSGGLLLLIGIATIIPGRLHGISGRILRWPILGFTYFMIAVEFVVFVIIRGSSYA